MKAKRILSYIFGGFCLLIAIGGLNSDNFGKVMTIIFLGLAIIILPTFDILSNLLNKKFTLKRKIGLGLGTFFIPFFVIPSETEKLTTNNVIVSLTSIIIFWIIMFATNKKQYADIEEKTIMKKTEKNDFFHKIYDSIIQKRNDKVLKELEMENKVVSSFKDLDVLTTHAIANMVSETKQKHISVFNEDMPEIDISNVLMSFVKDILYVNDEYSLNNLYTPLYYKNKINKYFGSLSNYIKKKIKDSSSSSNKSNYVSIHNGYINILCDSMPTFEKIKFYGAISSQAEEMKKYKNYSLNDVNYKYRDSYIYMIDMLLTCTCIAKMIFVEKIVKSLDINNEFYRVVSNMAKEIDDANLIVEKTKPIYDEFYKEDLGFINDELLYGIAVTIIVNKIRSKDVSSSDKKILNIVNKNIDDFDIFNNDMTNWIYKTAQEYRTLEINRYIIYRIVNIINLSNFKLYFDALGETKNYNKIYYENVSHNNKVSDKERYLNGDFEKEKKEQSEKYSLNNITTGTQFELYLVNLFNELGYKTKHNGKAGDQGADLILKKDDFVYVVQAKYYTGKLSNTPVQEIVGAMKYYNANQGVVVTNSSFTVGAKELAKANNVILIDGKALKKLVDYIFDDNHNDDVLQDFI